MKLPGQQYDGEERQERHCRDGAEAGLLGQKVCGRPVLHGAREQGRWPAEHEERHENADREKRHQLDDRLGRDREHEPILMLRRVDMPRSKKNRECRHSQGDQQRQVPERPGDDRGFDIGMRQNRPQGSGHGLELKRDVGIAPMMAMTATVAATACPFP